MGKAVLKVRAIPIGPDGEVYGITSGKQAHVLQLVGGSMKPSETRREAILREIREESGFTKIRILRRLKGTTKTRREDGTVEITAMYLVRVWGKRRKAAMTGRESARGLRLTEFGDLDTLERQLRKRVKRYGRTAARRDLELARMAREYL